MYFDYEEPHLCESNKGYQFDFNKLGFNYDILYKSEEFINKIYEYYVNELFCKKIEQIDDDELYEKWKSEFNYKKKNIIFYLKYTYKIDKLNVKKIIQLFKIFDGEINQESKNELNNFFSNNDLDKSLKEEIKRTLYLIL